MVDRMDRFRVECNDEMTVVYWAKEFKHPDFVLFLESELGEDTPPPSPAGQEGEGGEE